MPGGLFDPSNDFAVIDSLQTITYYVRTAEGVYATGVALTSAFMEPAGHEEILRAGGLLSDVATILHVWTANLGGTIPKVGDRWVDPSGASWQVRRVDVETWQTRYKLTCLKER